MNNKIYFLAFFSFLLAQIVFGQGETCEDAQPICSDSSYQFYHSGEDNQIPGYYTTSCLTTTPGPSWYYMQIEDPGDIELVMTGYEADVANPNTLDIDFACWGPFDTYQVCGDNGYLVVENEEDCSYAPDHTEYCNITNASSGDYYILLITNFAKVPAIIEFYQESGNGSTNCFIVDVDATSNSPLCQGESIQLTANEIENATYEWSGPAGFSATGREVSIPNASSLNAGEYSLVVTVDGAPNDPVYTYVDVNPNPTTDAGPDQSIFHGMYTTLNGSVNDPDNVSVYWEPPDLVSNPNIQDPQTENLTETTQFTLTAIYDETGCTDSATVTIDV